MHHLDEYLATAKRCVEVDPTFAKGYLRLAHAYRRMRRYDDETIILIRGLDMDHANNTSMRRELNEVESVLKTRETYESWL